MPFTTYPTIIPIGAPGTGKGTLIDRMRQERPRRYFSLSSGQMLRDLVQQGGELAQIVHQNNIVGKLTDDETMCTIFRERLAREELGGKYLIADGIPRTVAQASMLADILNTRHIFYLQHRNDELLVERAVKRRQEAIQKGENPRADDTPETMRKRLIVYREQTLPLLHYYRSLPGSPRIHVFDAEQSKEDVWQQTRRAILHYDI